MEDAYGRLEILVQHRIKTIMVNNYNNWKLIAVGSIAAILFVGTPGLSSMSRQVDYEQIVSNSKAFA